MTVSRENVYIIIPVHNRKAITLQCLDILDKNGDLKKYYVIVVDDGSTDGTSEAIQSLYPDIIILVGDGNLWWTGAIKKGMEYAYERGAEYFIWLNDDSLTAPDTLDLLVEFLGNYPDSIVGASCYASESGELVETGFKGRLRIKAGDNEVVEVEGLSGYCVGMSASIFRRIGEPDAAKFRQYAGDGMYTLKATRAGFKAYILGKAKVALIAEKNPIHNFSSYVNKSKNRTLKLIFWDYKSPYHLPTQFYYHTYKYGYLIGLPLFIVKATFWVINFYV